MEVEKYSPTQESIRIALANYIGSLYESSNFRGEVQKSNVNSIILEELTKLVVDENDHISMVASTSILNAAAWILRRRCKDIKEMITDKKEFAFAKSSLDELEDIAYRIEKYVEKIK